MNKYIFNFFYLVIFFQLFLWGGLKYLGIYLDFVRYLIDIIIFLISLFLLGHFEKINKSFTLVYLFLVIVSLISLAINDTTFLELVRRLRLQIVGFSVFTIFYYIRSYYKIGLQKIVYLIYVIGFAQLPLVLVQYIYYPSISGQKVGAIFDFVSGSIGYGETGIMSICLVFLSFPIMDSIINNGMNLKKLVAMIWLLSPILIGRSDFNLVQIPVIIFLFLLSNQTKSINVFSFLKKSLSVAIFTLIFFQISKSLIGITPYSYAKNYAIGSTLDNFRMEDHRMMRLGSTISIIKDKKQIFGKGPGYWIERGPDGDSPETNIWYHASSFTLLLGELGYFGLAWLTLMILLIVKKVNTNIKIPMIFYIIMLNLYNHPFTRFNTILVIVFLIMCYGEIKKFDRNSSNLHAK